MERNWAGNHAYGARVLHRPGGVEEVRELAAGRERIRVLGTRHSFTAIADSEELMLLDALPAEVRVDHARGVVSVAGGVSYGALAAELAREGVALANLASLPHISVAGAVATATHGSGDRNGNLATCRRGPGARDLRRRARHRLAAATRTSRATSSRSARSARSCASSWTSSRPTR